MIVINLDAHALRRLLLMAVMAVAGWWVVSAAVASAQDAALPRYAFVARADNPVDALAASAIAGQLGAPVFLTDTAALVVDTRDALVAHAPNVVVLAGGTAALSDTVAAQVAEALPAAEVLRFGGTNRTQTAVLLNQLLGQLGVQRPVLAGATVAGDVGIDGTLTLDGTDVGAALAALADRIDQLEADAVQEDERIDQLEDDLSDAVGRIDEAVARIDELNARLDGVTRDGDTLTFTGMNLHVVNGLGETATTNGLGNLVIGYGEDFLDNDVHGDTQGDGTADVRTGSHNLVIGIDHSYTRYAGVVAGRDNRVSGRNSSVLGGRSNHADGDHTAVTGGAGNHAQGDHSAVVGGISNTASGSMSSVLGGIENDASGFWATVAGGSNNTASGNGAAVSGGYSSNATAQHSSVTGGRDNVADHAWSTIGGGRGRSISSAYDTRIGAEIFPDS